MGPLRRSDLTKTCRRGYKALVNARERNHSGITRHVWAFQFELEMLGFADEWPEPWLLGGWPTQASVACVGILRAQIPYPVITFGNGLNCPTQANDRLEWAARPIAKNAIGWGTLVSGDSGKSKAADKNVRPTRVSCELEILSAPTCERLQIPFGFG